MTYYDHQFVSQYIKIPGYVDSKVKADYASEKVAVRHCVKLAITNLLAHGTTAYSRRREFYSENHTKYYTHRHFLNAVDLVVKDGYASFCKRGHRQIMRFPKGISSKLKPLDRLYADYPKPSKSPKIDLKALPLLTIDKKPIYKKREIKQLLTTMFYQSPTLINQPFSIQHQSTTTSITPYGTFLEGIFEKSLYLNRHYFNKLKLDFINLKWHLVEARFLLCLQQLPQSQKHNKEVEVITMVYNFDRKKQELTGLLALIREGQATLEDARERLVSERVKLLEPTEKQRNIIKAMELLLEEKQTNLVNLTKSYIGSEGELTIKRLANEKSQGFPWLAKAYDDYFRLKHSALAEYLEQKPQPALKAAEELRQISKERREAEQAARLAQYLLDYCRFLAPWLDEYIGMEVDELDQIIKDVHSSWQKKEEELDEEVKRWIGPSEWEKLAPTERLQRKLDWYWKKPNKSNWQLGRDYERYIGYLYEQKGWNVYYHGKKGYEDLGRDLICKKGNSVEIVQCKYWAREKVIHEKHVYYLFGTTVEYFLENFGEQAELQLALFPSLITRRNVMPKLITTVQVSPKAGQVAKVLKVSIEKVPFQRYPSVKCNVSRRTGERIYHLPFDQQYDAILIEEERLERYAETVAEAEALGFRHAYRWKGETTE